MWIIIVIIFVTLLLLGFIYEIGKLKGQVEAREYEKKMLENRLKQLEK